MPESCVFCRIVNGEVPAHIVHDDDKIIVFLDSGPLFPGHALICPKTHYDTMYDVPKKMLEPLFSTAQRLGQAIERALGAEGTFVAINNRVSQSVPHLHVHVIPRRRKDGMKGFFWPRRPYRDDKEAAETAATLRRAMAELP